LSSAPHTLKKTLEESIQNVTYHPNDRAARLRALPLPEQSATVVALSPYVQQQLLLELTIDETVALLDHMDLLTAQTVLRRIKDVRRRHKIITQLKSEVKEKVEYFLRFHPKATLSLIHFNYVMLSVGATVGAAGDAIDRHYKETGKFPEVLVHRDGVLLGEVSLATLVRERNTLLLDHFVTTVATISYQAEMAEVLDILSVSKRKKIVVLDVDASVLGIIYADDAIELFGKLPAESLYSFAGVDSSERPFDSAYDKFRNRYKWLVVNLVTAFFAGSVILLFQDTVDKLSILAVYIPIVAGMGGNAASQTFAVMLRGITLGTISLKTGFPAVMKEMLAGLYNGVAIGLIVALISVFFNGSAWLGLVVALAMIVVHIVAGLFGAFVPLLVKVLGKDPAAISMIFISTATDVFGLLALLGFGALILM
jgi:magnesium transporter